MENEELKTELEWENIQMNYLLAPRRKKTRNWVTAHMDLSKAISIQTTWNAFRTG